MVTPHTTASKSVRNSIVAISQKNPLKVGVNHKMLGGNLVHSRAQDIKEQLNANFKVDSLKGKKTTMQQSTSSLRNSGIAREKLVINGN